VLYVAGWIFFCVAAGMFAHIRRNRYGAEWFLVALVFSPLVAFVLLAILKEGPPRLRPIDTLSPEALQALRRRRDIQAIVKRSWLIATWRWASDHLPDRRLRVVASLAMPDAVVVRRDRTATAIDAGHDPDAVDHDPRAGRWPSIIAPQRNLGARHDRAAGNLSGWPASGNWPPWGTGLNCCLVPS
jgi:hypothetical protein